MFAVQRLYTFPAGYDDRCAAIIDFFTQYLLDFFHVLASGTTTRTWPGRRLTQIRWLRFIGSGRVLTSCHCRSEIVRDDDGYGTVTIYGIEQTRHTRMRKSRVADDGDGRKKSRIGRTFGHSNRRAHVYATVDGPERRQCPQCIASYVAENFGCRHFGNNFVNGGIYVPMSATLTQGGRTGYDNLRCA